MNTRTMAAAGIITAAFILYTIGIFAERAAGTLKPRHLIFFWLGLACDAGGTLLMTSIAQTTGITAGAHAVTGTLALGLMLFHALWATLVLVRGSQQARKSFHKLSLGVWLFWLVPYLCGLLMGIPALHLTAPAATTYAVAASLGVGAVLGTRSRARRRANRS